MSFLLDTCVISELISRTPAASVVEWLDGQDEHHLFLSVITLGEIKRGVDRLPVSRRKDELDSWLHSDLLQRFAGRLVAIDTDVMLEWGALVAKLESEGRILPAMDSLIAATALHNDLSIVTRNERDFQGTGVHVVNPWPLQTS